MATLNKHDELGQIERLDHKLAYCVDGQILRNQGDGWKLWRKLKPGIDAREHFAKVQATYDAKLADNPCFREWRSLLHDAIPFRLRFMARQAVSLMPDDPDGVWSEINDFTSLTEGAEIISLDETIALCRAYRSALQEQSDKRAAQPAIA